MRIILEGPDNAGKSTLARALADRLDMNLRGKIVRVAPNDVIEEHYRDLRKKNTIFDRCYMITNMVYEPITNPEVEGSPFAECLLIHEAMLKTLNVVLIYVTCSEEVLKQRYDVEGDDIQNWDQILAAHRGYEQYMQETELIPIKVDTSDGIVLEKLDTIIKEIKEAVK